MVAPLRVALPLHRLCSQLGRSDTVSGTKHLNKVPLVSQHIGLVFFPLVFAVPGTKKNIYGHASIPLASLLPLCASLSGLSATVSPPRELGM